MDLTHQFTLNEELLNNLLQPARPPEVQLQGTRQYLILEVDFLVQPGGFWFWDLHKQNWSQLEPLKSLMVPQK